VQAISSICERNTNSPVLGDLLSDEDKTIVNKLASSSNHVLTKLIDEIELMSANSPSEAAKADRIIKSECVAAVEEYLSRDATDTALGLKSVMQVDAQQMLDKADVDLLQCGYDRRTLMIVPSRNESSEAIEALTKARPTAAVIPAEVE